MIAASQIWNLGNIACLFIYLASLWSQNCGSRNTLDNLHWYSLRVQSLKNQLIYPSSLHIFLFRPNPHITKPLLPLKTWKTATLYLRLTFPFGFRSISALNKKYQPLKLFFDCFFLDLRTLTYVVLRKKHLFVFLNTNILDVLENTRFFLRF